MQNKVLLIDDDDITHMIGSRLIKITSFAKEIITLNNGMEGIEYFDKLIRKIDPNYTPPEIVFLDINMPLLDGWGFLEEFSQKYHKQFPSIEIYMLSSSDDPEDKARANYYPFVKDYIVKPLTKENLEQIKTRNLEGN